jgi:hypothetical protein
MLKKSQPYQHINESSFCRIENKGMEETKLSASRAKQIDEPLGPIPGRDGVPLINPHQSGQANLVWLVAAQLLTGATTHHLSDLSERDLTVVHRLGAGSSMMKTHPWYMCTCFYCIIYSNSND